MAKTIHPNIIISAAEITKGMKSVGSKSLLKIKNDTTIIEYQIQQLKTHYPKSPIYVLTGFESDKVNKVLSRFRNVHTIYNEQYKTTNQCHGIVKCFEQYSLSNALIISSGVICKIAFNIIDISTVYLIDKEKENFTIGCGESSSTKAEYLFYDLPKKWTECVFLNQSAINTINDTAKRNKTDQMFLFEMINMLIDQGEGFDINTIQKKHIIKIGGIKDIRKAKVFCNENFYTEVQRPIHK
jgi:hypothetical protein